MKVLKFGGTSVGSPEMIEKVKEIVESQPQNSIVVVSAFKGVTDQLMRMLSLAKQRNDSYKEELESMIKRHHEAIEALTPNKGHQDSMKRNIDKSFDELANMLNGIYFLKEVTNKISDHVLSFGELLSAYIIGETIDEGFFIDSRKVIITDNHFGKANVNFEITNNIIQKKLEGGNKTFILPGFIASDEEGETTTLGRGGSDYTAAIIASGLNADVLEIWTDVDGVLTANPKIVEGAFAVEQLSYAEAMELSHFGAKVIYTPTIRPVYLKNIPVVIKNTFNPNSKGTVISRKGDTGKDALIKGISSIDDVAMLTLQGAGMAGVPGIASRLFGVLADREINIIMITQASSEHSISFAIDPADTDKAQKGIAKEFYKEMELDKDIQLDIEPHLSIIAVVGEGMKHTPGISASLFHSLGTQNINVVGIAQGSSELNISVIITKGDLNKALNVIHKGFFPG